MRIERLRPAVLRVTVHPLELAALVAAARWAAEGGEGELPAEAKENIHQVLVSYETELARLDAD